MSWRHGDPEKRREGVSQCVMELEAAAAATKLTVRHSIEIENSKLIASASGAWPQVLSNLKSFMESDEIVLRHYHS